jgi:hypothetical protein
MDGAATSHRCAAQKSCRDKDPQRRPAIIDTRRGLCRRCTQQIRHAFQDLARDLVALDGAVADRLTVAAEHVNRTADPAMPLNGPVLALRATLSDWCEAAVEMVADNLNIEPAVRHKAKGFPVYDDHPIRQAHRVIPDNLKLLLEAQEQPVCVWNRAGTARYIEDMDGITVALQVWAAHRQIAAAIGETNPRRRLGMPCPALDCGAPTLGIDNGQTDVNCTSCGGRWTEAEYDWLSGLLLSDLRQHEKDEDTMLKWLLAEAGWQRDVAAWLLAERNFKLGKITSLQEGDVRAVGSWALLAVLKEVVA